MPKSLKTKVGNQKALHPYSRKAAQLARQEHHNSRKIKRKQESGVRLGIQSEKLIWFQDNLMPDKNELDKTDVLNLIERYLLRFKDELEQINIMNSIKGRQGRQHAAREDSIKMTLEREKREFEQSGLEIPDLFDKKNVGYLRNWTKELRYLQNMKMKTVSRKDLM